MHFTPAPLFTDVAPGPEGGEAHWVHAPDGVRLRVGHWTPENAKGTVLLFPGRTEYVEKYGPAAADLAQRGYATLTIDWRGQGLADRLLDDRRVGHVTRFSDYQTDVATMLRAAQALNLPRPFFLIAHSMGGCIGLRSLVDGLDVNAAVFTGPMWGIRISTVMRPTAWALSWSSNIVGLGHYIAPTMSATPYVQANDFADNQLTTDPEMYKMMRDQLDANPDLALGGPSLTWLHEALRESLELARRCAPNVPCVTWIGSRERVVEVQRIKDRISSWPIGQLNVVDDAEHEVLMEGPEIRQRIFDSMAELFDANLTRVAAARTA